METADHPTAVVVPIRTPPALARLRRRWDSAAAEGAGSHVTILYPFLPASALGPAVRSALADVARTTRPFEAMFQAVRTGPGLVWIEPREPDGFAAISAEVAARWPDHPPYEGRHAEVVPHLTTVNRPGAPIDTLVPTVGRWVPFEAQARRVELWRRGPGGRWRTHWRLDLGGER